MRVSLNDDLLLRLRAHRASRGYTDEVVRAHDAFILDGGMGPCVYLTPDGRVLVDASGWDDDDEALREATDDEVTSAIVVGAKRTGIAGLLELLPPPAPGSVPCPRCNAERWMDFGRDVHGKVGRVVCWDCSGRGWMEASR